MAGSAARRYRGECGVYIPGTWVKIGERYDGYNRSVFWWSHPSLYPSLAELFHTRNRIDLLHRASDESSVKHCLIAKRGIINCQAGPHLGLTDGAGWWFDAYYILFPWGQAAWTCSRNIIPMESTEVNEDPFDKLPRHLWPEICEI